MSGLELQPIHPPPTSLLRRYVFSTDHKVIAKQFLWAGLLFLLFVTIILDQYFLNVPAGFDNEFGILRTFWEALSESGTGQFLHQNVIPNFVAVFSFLLPDYIEATYAVPTTAWWSIRA